MAKEQRAKLTLVFEEIKKYPEAQAALESWEAGCNFEAWKKQPDADDRSKDLTGSELLLTAEKARVDSFVQSGGFASGARYTLEVFGGLVQDDALLQADENTKQGLAQVFELTKQKIAEAKTEAERKKAEETEKEKQKKATVASVVMQSAIASLRLQGKIGRNEALSAFYHWLNSLAQEQRERFFSRLAGLGEDKLVEIIRLLGGMTDDNERTVYATGMTLI